MNAWHHLVVAFLWPRHHFTIGWNTKFGVNSFALCVRNKLSLIIFSLRIFRRAEGLWPIFANFFAPWCRFSITFPHERLVTMTVSFVCRHLPISQLKYTIIRILNSFLSRTTKLTIPSARLMIEAGKKRAHGQPKCRSSKSHLCKSFIHLYWDSTKFENATKT